MVWVAMERTHLALCVCATIACNKVDSGPPLLVIGEAMRVRSGDLPRSSPYFDGKRVVLAAARGETLGIQVWHTEPGPVTLSLPGAHVEAYAVELAHVVRPSTALYGGSQGKGDYPDGLVAAEAPASNPAYFEISAQQSGAGELVVGGRRVPVQLTVAPVALPALPLWVWAYYQAKQLGGTDDAPNDAERACIAMFRARGVLLSPDLAPSAWPARRELLAGAPFVPAVIPDDPARVGDAVTAWITNTAGTGQVPFAIPIDEPHTDEARAKVRAIGDAVHAAGGGPGKFLLAVTDDARADYGDSVDLAISVHARDGGWTYNGAPPRAGSMVVDAESPGLRTWGWIAWKWHVPIWYVWDALYWHDRHNKRDDLIDPARDAVSFDDGDDHGNLDGVLALPGCKPTLRLAALRRGLQDRQLLELAAKCDPAATAALAQRMVPRALGDAPDRGEPSWPLDEQPWIAAHDELLRLAASCVTR
jgi:hypothetical protein